MVELLLTPTQLNSPSALDECPRWVFRMTDVEATEYQRRLVYQLCDGNGAPVSKEHVFIPVEGKEFTIDFSKEIACHLCTRLPSLPNVPYGIPIIAPDIKNDYQLKWSERTFDKITCADEITQSSPAIGETFSYINWTANYDDPYLGSPSILNLKPLNNFVCKDSFDLLYICGDITITGVMEFQDGGIANLPTLNITASVVPEYIGIGPGNVFPAGAPSDLKKIIWTLSTGEVITYTIVCCECPVDIFFLSHRGGYHSFTFHNEVSTSFLKNSSRYRITSNSNFKNNTEYLIGTGLRNTTQTSNRTKTYYVDLDMIEDECLGLKIEDFLASDYKFIRIKNKNGDFRSLPVTISDSNYVTDVKEGNTLFTITITIENDFLTANGKWQFA